jgi:hypothetical protein
VLLVPAILALVWSRSRRASIVPGARLAIAAGGALLVWPWIATTGLSAASVWLTPDLRQKLLFIPFRFNFELPIVVFALALLESWPAKSRNLRHGAAQE